ncbi:MAG: glycosyltransferase [Bacteroidia bacterium]
MHQSDNKNISILINAYACAPNKGSEPGMAWNWIVNLANYCELYVITEGEWQKEIEIALVNLPQKENLHFYYNPVSEKIRKMCWNQGDWRFYKHYENWQKETLRIAKQIVVEHNIDILHQLNMIGFREPGYLWKIENIPFVWGPIGGLKQFPLAYSQGGGKKIQFFYLIKNSLNILQLKLDRRVNKAMHRADLLISSIPDSYNAIKKYKGLESVWIPETGCFITDDIPTDRFDDKEFHILWVGKFDFRKQLTLALNALAATKNKQIILDVYGQGSNKHEKEAKRIVADLNIDNQVVWHGNQSNRTVQNAMRKAQLFLFTSVSEDTSTVVLEAISNRLPVLCFNSCGFGAVIDDKVGRKISLTNPEQSNKEFAEQMNMLFNNRELLKELSINCKFRQQQLSWDEKAIFMVSKYKELK